MGTHSLQRAQALRSKCVTERIHGDTVSMYIVGIFLLFLKQR